MWWTTDNQVQREAIRFHDVLSRQQHLQGRSTPTNQKRRDLKTRYQTLPITAEQAAANLMLQQSGADCNAEVPRLRKDIRSLEFAVRRLVSKNELAASLLTSLRGEKHQQVEQMNHLLAELAALKSENENAQRRTREAGQWLTNTADFGNALVRKAVQQKYDAEQQVSYLSVALEHLRSDNQSLANQLESACQEIRIYADVISDMEARQASELQQAREQQRMLKNRLTQHGAADRSQVQQLNIRIVSQAAEIRSLEKQLAGTKGSRPVHKSEVNLISESGPSQELNQRLENSLQAARIELDAAVHDLNYANAEADRLRQYANQVEQQYDSEFYQVVQVAELHAALAAKLEQSSEGAPAGPQLQLESPLEKQATSQQPTVDELAAGNQELTEELKVMETLEKNNAVSAEKIESQAQELLGLRRELGMLRESQATLAGENETLSVSNQELEERLVGLTQRVAEADKARSVDKAEWEKLLAHHQGGTQVANAECRLIKGQLEDQRDTYEFKLKQQQEVIKCLKDEVETARGLHSQLEEKLEIESVSRKLAEQEIKLVKREAARAMDSLPAVLNQSQEIPSEVADDPGHAGDPECSVRPAA